MAKWVLPSRERWQLESMFHLRLYLDLAGKPMAFWNLFPRKASTQGWAWSDWCLCCRIRCPTMTLTFSSLILKLSKRYWSYCRLLWRFPGWLLVLSKIKQLYALPREGTCDHLPASWLILITVFWRSTGHCDLLSAATWLEALQSCPCHLSWDLARWSPFLLMSPPPPCSPLEPSRVRQHQKSHFPMSCLLVFICRAQVLGHTLGKWVRRTLTGSTWPTGCWLTTHGPSLWPWPMAADLTILGGGKCVLHMVQL